MIRSIRRFLIVSLLASVTVISSITAVGNYLLDKDIIEPLLETHPALANQNQDRETLVNRIHATNRELIDHITLNNIYILFVTYPVFGLLIWVIVTLSLRSVTRVAREISQRAPNHLEPVRVKDIPLEISPLVTELDRLFLRLKHAFERNRRFAADAAHELRTPLAAIKTQAQVALLTDDEECLTQALQKVIRGVDRSSHTVTQLLTLSRLGSEEALNDMTSVNLYHTVTETAAWLVPAAREKEITVSLAPAPDKAIIPGNEIALGILLRNIMDNAIRYTPNGGNIHIALKHIAQQVVLEVCDSGPGIPENLRTTVFSPFYRIPGTATEGSGLGLAIVQQIARLHHAQITLETATNGTGLVFRIAFPENPADH